MRHKYKKASSKIARRGRIRKIFGLSVFFAVVAIILIGPIFLLRADFMQIENVEVFGAEAVPAVEIKEAAAQFMSGNKLLFIPRTNTVLLNKDDLVEGLLAKFGRLEKVDVNKDFFQHSLELSVSERTAEFLWCSAMGTCYYMSGNGLVFEAASLQKNTSTSSGAVTDSQKIVFKGGLEGDVLMKNFASPSDMLKYSAAIKALQDSNLKVAYVNLESMDKISFGTDMGEIILNPSDTDLALSAQNALVLMQEIKSKNPSARFLYIDARFGNKVFYKLK